MNTNGNPVPTTRDHMNSSELCNQKICNMQRKPGIASRCSLTGAFHLFCKCTSVRGMSKLYSGPRFLRGMWLIFVLSMTCLLISSTALLIKDFLNYDVSVHTQLRLDDYSPFPALTICHQPPFSFNAYKLWKRAEILSPSNYNRYMRKLILEALLSNESQTASAIWGYDSQSVYYQNLAYNDAVRLGHTTAIFLTCMRSDANMIAFEDNCTLLSGYTMRRFSHHLYMNCYTFEPVGESLANGTTSFSLLVSMGPRDKDVELQQAFLPDVFEQARGLRVVVHEAGTMPNLENGLHVEPGKLNEINYEPYRWNRLNTPRRPCIHTNETHRFRDLENWFNYTHSDCLSTYQQAEIMQNCRCIYVLYPRPSLPNQNLPYCGQIWPEYNKTAFFERLTCLAHYLDNSIKRKYDGTVCLPRCNFYEYPSTTSITKWRGHAWQLYWLRVQNQASQELLKFQEQFPDHDIQQHASFKQWELYLTYNNLTHIPTTAELAQIANGTSWTRTLPVWPPEQLDLDSEDFAYVVIKRKSHNTVEKNEKLVLSLYVLVSRVGGLCSLTIGLTAAFLVELLEFLYLFYVQQRYGHGHPSKNSELGAPGDKADSVALVIPLAQLKQTESSGSG
ncbi:FMRFamide-activated amiloride-sensitive sodium channel [Paragonimus heterotremus]|uniref:FMRFamide-activated amiloride-sensitive sodium channel n=1 Tax=Paragonimus heterotremus TaxID=100268 RepID=A0A8J4WJ58_9TREM|nr:FMRFamide-activated amiloride-sensitive sodium channel [Paragonimus heterotremus]